MILEGPIQMFGLWNEIIFFNFVVALFSGVYVDR